MVRRREALVMTRAKARRLTNQQPPTTNARANLTTKVAAAVVASAAVVDVFRFIGRGCWRWLAAAEHMTKEIFDLTQKKKKRQKQRARKRGSEQHCNDQTLQR